MKAFQKRSLSIIIAFFVLAFTLSFAGCFEQTEYNSSYESARDTNGFVLPESTAEVSIHTELQKQYLSLENLYNVNKLADGTKELSRPLSHTLSWNRDGDKPVAYARVSLAEDISFSDADVKTVMTDSAQFYNLKVGTKYYWKVTIAYKDGSAVTSNVATFSTENAAPRNIFIDGSTNWRDMGGWTTSSQKTVKQGLIYRTGRINSSNNTESISKLTYLGLAEATEHLKIKTEIDLRGEAESSYITKSVLGENVNYYRFSMNYEGTMLDNNANEVKRVFEVLGDIENYPVIFHCHIGTDRTGFVAYLINGLLGVSKQDLYRDYLFSNFGNIDGPRSLDDIANRYVAALDAFDGNTLSQKIENYLLSVGVKEQTIRKIKQIML